MIKTAIFNRKGGIGKTTSVFQLGAVLAVDYGFRVLLIDFEPQANLSTTALGNNDDYLEGKSLGIQHALWDMKSTAECIYSVSFDFKRRGIFRKKDTGFSVLPMLTVRQFLDEFSDAFAGEGDHLSADLYSYAEKEYHLENIENVLKQVENHFDFCLIDCPPSIEGASNYALNIADNVLIPFDPEIYSVQGLSTMTDIVHHKSTSGANPKLQLVGAFASNLDPGDKDAHMWYEELLLENPDLFMQSVIHSSRLIRKSKDTGKPVVWGNATSKAAREYRALAAEYLTRIGNVY